jgi:hypothetical protein
VRPGSGALKGDVEEASQPRVSDEREVRIVSNQRLQELKHFVLGEVVEAVPELGAGARVVSHNKCVLGPCWYDRQSCTIS